MQKKAKLIQDILDELFPSPQIPLTHSSAFTLLIAVLLSAQCQDERVNQVTPLLFAKAKTPEDMSLLPLIEIEEIIRPCGLFRMKSKAIQGLSAKLVKEFGCAVPSNLEELESLPGVGHKTASVILAQCFQKPAFPVDTHIHRLAKRWGLSKARSVKETEEDLKKIFPKKSWIKLHLQIIYYARAYCPARGHKTEKCPICQTLEKSKKPLALKKQ